MQSNIDLKIVLIAPEIPGNTGSIGRTCVALGAELILIKPYGFDIDEKAVRRAGLDYWKYVKLKEFDNFDQFLDSEKPDPTELFLFSRFSNKVYFEATFPKRSYVIFGAETTGIPQEIKNRFEERLFCLPQFSDKIRSLNLSNVATAVAYEAIRQNFLHT
jgi:tRNA (cytidine/uridine-2'-O-)-methyltransferase